jgi:glycosyltransferase involved in cell wall biosynthesis
MSTSQQTSRPIRVLHVIDSLGAAGAEHQLVTLIPHLRRHGVECEVAALQAPYTLQPLLEDLGVTVHALDLRNSRNFILASRRLSALLKRKHYDIVHAHLWYSITAVGFSRRSSSTQKRFLTFHNSVYQQYPPKSLVRRARKVFDRLLLRYRIDRCIAVTQFIATSNKALLAIPRVDVIFNGLDLDQIPRFSEQERLKIREQLGCSQDEFLIVTAGRLEEQKGHTVLIDAVASLAHTAPAIKVLIFGQGSIRQLLQNKISSLGLESKVTLAGSVDHPSLFRAIAAADVFVFPSVHEPFGLAAAEAMAIGTPVVASAVDGLPELVEDGVSGKLVPARDAEQLSRAIGELMQDPALRQRLAAAARQRARALFDIAALSGDLASAYRKALGADASQQAADGVSA